MEDIRYTDDVKEAVALAQKEARKAKSTTITDRDYLCGLLLAHRKFNRLDSLLAELHTSPSRLRDRLYKAQANNRHPSEMLQLAESLAKNSQNGHVNPHMVTVDVEHLLKAACLSTDPTIRDVFQENRISPEAIDQSLHGVKNKQTRRTVLFVGKELLEVVVFVLIFLILIKSFIGELRLIPSESMVPGLQVSDRLVIERVTHWTRPYERGDILVFYPPMTTLNKDPLSVFMRITGFSGLFYKKEDNIDVAYIKRLIGLPGDKVEVRPGDGVYVNGKKLDEPYVNEIANTCTVITRDGQICGPITVPPHSYFMMGDNRNLSLDSRYWGFADDKKVIGRAIFRIWPLNRIGELPPPPYQH